MDQALEGWVMPRTHQQSQLRKYEGTWKGTASKCGEKIGGSWLAGWDSRIEWDGETLFEVA